MRCEVGERGSKGGAGGRERGGGEGEGEGSGVVVEPVGHDEGAGSKGGRGSCNCILWYSAFNETAVAEASAEGAL